MFIDENEILDEPDILLEQIRIWRDLQQQMIGWLYSSMLQDQTERLLNRYHKTKESHGK